MNASSHVQAQLGDSEGFQFGVGLRAKQDSPACPGSTLSFSDTSVYDPAHPTVLDLMADEDTGDFDRLQ